MPFLLKSGDLQVRLSHWPLQLLSCPWVLLTLTLLVPGGAIKFRNHSCPSFQRQETTLTLRDTSGQKHVDLRFGHQTSPITPKLVKNLFLLSS